MRKKIGVDVPVIRQESVRVSKDKEKITHKLIAEKIDTRISASDAVHLSKGKEHGKKTIEPKGVPEILNIEPVWDKGYTGKGVTVAIISSGIHPHPDFKDRIVAFKDFIGRKDEPYDDVGSGTHVAGLAVGGGKKYPGAAPEAKLVGVKVFDKEGVGTASDVIKGIDWVVEHKDEYGINVLSLPLDGPVAAHDDPISLAIERAVKEGITVVVASPGNEGPEIASRPVASPGVAPTAFTVGAKDEKEVVPTSILMEDNLIPPELIELPYSEKIKKPDLYAPTVPSALTYPNLSGTSMPGVLLKGTNTAAVTGIAALLLQVNPNLTPHQVKEVLLSTVKPEGIDVEEAIEKAKNLKSQGTLGG